MLQCRVQPKAHHREDCVRRLWWIARRVVCHAVYARFLNFGVETVRPKIRFSAKCAKASQEFINYAPAARINHDGLIVSP